MGRVESPRVGFVSTELGLLALSGWHSMDLYFLFGVLPRFSASTSKVLGSFNRGYVPGTRHSGASYAFAFC